MLFNQVRIRYNKDSWLVSSYLTEFLKMCGFVVYEEKMDDEITDLETAEENFDEEIIINAKPKELGKQLLEETIAEYLADAVDTTKLHFLVDVYVDFSVYEFLMWLDYYCKYNSEENADTNEAKFLSVLTFLADHNKQDRNEFSDFALLYCKYKIDVFDDLREKIIKFSRDEFYIECSKLIKEFHNLFCISGNILLGMLQEQVFWNNRSTEAILCFNKTLDYCLPHHKAFIYYHIAKIYSRYKAKSDTCTIPFYRKAISLQPDIWGLSNFINLLLEEMDSLIRDVTLNHNRNQKILDITNEIISLNKQVLSLLDKKEIEIPLNPKELRIRCCLIVNLMQVYYYEPLNVFEKPAQLRSYLEESYSKIDTSNFGNICDLKEFSPKDGSSIIKNSLNSIMKSGYTLMYFSYCNLGHREYAQLYREKAGF